MVNNYFIIMEWITQTVSGNLIPVFLIRKIKKKKLDGLVVVCQECFRLKYNETYFIMNSKRVRSIEKYKRHGKKLKYRR